MTVQVSNDDLIATFAHALADRARVARLWEAQAKEWEAVAKEWEAVASVQRAEIDTLTRALAAVEADNDRLRAETVAAAIDIAMLEHQRDQLQAGEDAEINALRARVRELEMMGRVLQ